MPLGLGMGSFAQQVHLAIDPDLPSSPTACQFQNKDQSIPGESQAIRYSTALLQLTITLPEFDLY